MANTILTPSVIAKEALMQVANNCVAGNLVFRGYEKEWQEKVNGWKKGQSITAKAPIHFRVQDGETLIISDIREEDVSLSLDYRKHVGMKLTGTEMSYTLEEFSDRIIKEAARTLGNFIDETVLSMYKYIPNQVGTPGTTPSSMYTIAEAGAVLTDEAVPKDNRFAILDPWATAKIADNVKGLLSQKMVEDAVKKGKIGMLSGFDLYESQNVDTHTCGTAAGTTALLVDGAASEGAVSITIDENGSWSKTFKQGDIFTVASVNGVNPISGNSHGRLRQFVVEADVAASGTEQAVSCTPGVAPYNIYSASAGATYLPYQTVDALPADNAAVTCAGSASLAHKVNIAAHEHAMALFMCPVRAPQGLSPKTMTENGFTITVTTGSDIVNYVEYIRFDVLFGIKAINPFLACRIAG